MKQSFFLFFAFFVVLSAKAQVAKWMIPAAYDTIRMENNGYLIVTDSGRTQWVTIS